MSDFIDDLVQFGLTEKIATAITNACSIKLSEHRGGLTVTTDVGEHLVEGGWERWRAIIVVKYLFKNSWKLKKLKKLVHESEFVLDISYGDLIVGNNLEELRLVSDRGLSIDKQNTNDRLRVFRHCQGECKECWKHIQMYFGEGEKLDLKRNTKGGSIGLSFVSQTSMILTARYKNLYTIMLSRSMILSRP